MMVQTEIGLLPEDWEVVRLEDQFKTFATASFSRDQMSDQGEVMCIHYGDIHTKYGNIVDANKDEIPFVSTSQAARYKLLKDGDILLADASEDDEGIGKPIAVICHDKKIIAGLHILPLRPKNDECWDVRFPSYLFSGRMVKGQVEKLSEGTKVNSITYNKIKDVLVPLPKDKTEQQNIATALSSIDKLIDDLGRTIQKKQRIREGAMEEFLSGKKRLPGFTEEWVEKPISYFGSFKGQTINPSATPNEIFSEYSMPAYDEGMKPFQAKGSDMLSSRTQIEGEVLLVNKLNVRQRRIWHIYNCEDNAICSGEFLPFKSTVIALDYLKQLLLTEKVVNDFIDLSTGTSNSQKRVTPKQILDYQITVPSDIREQHAIADILTSMDDEISLLESERAKYEQIRSGMMEELLTGKKRLK